MNFGATLFTTVGHEIEVETKNISYRLILHSKIRGWSHNPAYYIVIISNEIPWKPSLIYRLLELLVFQD